jgi:cation-transporting ATPase E
LIKTGTITENQMQVQRFFAAQQAQIDDNRLRSLISDFCAAMPGDNSTMKAMKEYFTQGSGRQADQIVPFSSAWKYSGVGFGNESYVLGAPEMVLRESAAMFSSEFEPLCQARLSGPGIRSVSRAADQSQSQCAGYPIRIHFAEKSRS